MFEYLHKSDQIFRYLSGGLLLAGGLLYVIGGWKQLHPKHNKYESKYDHWYRNHYDRQLESITNYNFAKYWLFGMPCIITALDILMNWLTTKLIFSHIFFFHNPFFCVFFFF